MRAEEYLTILTDQIWCRMAREDVRKELLCHIEDQKAAFLSEAEEAAVREMGDPVETGNELDRIHRPKMAWGDDCADRGAEHRGISGTVSAAGKMDRCRRDRYGDDVYDAGASAEYLPVSEYRAGKKDVCKAVSYK